VCLGKIPSCDSLTLVVGMTLLRPSVFGLARALATVAVHDGEFASGLLGDCLHLIRDRGVSCGSENGLGAMIEVVQTCGAVQHAALTRALSQSWNTFDGQVQLHVPTLARLLSALVEAAVPDLFQFIARVIATHAGSSKASLLSLLTPASAFVLCPQIGVAKAVVAPLATELVLGLSRLSWTALCIPGESLMAKLGSSTAHGRFEHALIEAWLQFIIDAHRHFHTALSGEALAFAVAVAASAVAAPAFAISGSTTNTCSVPLAALEFLAAKFDTVPALQQQVRHALLGTPPAGLCNASQMMLGSLALCGLARLSVQRKGAAVLARHAVAAADGIALMVGAADFSVLAKQASIVHGLPELGVGKGKNASSERLLRHLSSANCSSAPALGIGVSTVIARISGEMQ